MAKEEAKRIEYKEVELIIIETMYDDIITSSKDDNAGTWM